MGTVTLSREGSALRAALVGELDVGSVAALHRELVGQLDGASTLELDLAAVEAIDLAGVQWLEWLHRASAARQLTLTFAHLAAPAQAAAASLGLGGWLKERAS